MPRAGAPDLDLAYCAERLRREAPDLWRAALWSPPPARAGLIALFALDREMEAVVLSTTEPRIGQIRLAWWRERLEALDTPAIPPAQPTLQSLAAHVLPKLSGSDLSALEDGFMAWIGGDLEGAARLRGETLFSHAAQLLAGDDRVVRGAGQAWATGTMRRFGLDLAPVAPPRRMSRRLRPLLALARLGARDPAEPALAPARQLVFVKTLLFG